MSPSSFIGRKSAIFRSESGEANRICEGHEDFQRELSIPVLK